MLDLLVYLADPTKILTRRELGTVLADLKRKAPRSPNTRINLILDTPGETRRPPCRPPCSLANALVNVRFIKIEGGS